MPQPRVQDYEREAQAVQDLDLADIARGTMGTIHHSLGGTPSSYFAQWRGHPWFSQLVGLLLHELRDTPLPSPQPGSGASTSPELELPTHVDVLHSHTPFTEHLMALQRACQDLKGENADKMEDLRSELRQSFQIFFEEPLMRSLFDVALSAIDVRGVDDTSAIDETFLQAIRALKRRVLPARRRRNLPPAATRVLFDWISSHAGHPYASEAEKRELSDKAGVSVGQVSNWLSNRRNRRAGLRAHSDEDGDFSP